MRSAHREITFDKNYISNECVPFFFFLNTPGLKLSALSSVVKVLSVHMLLTRCAKKLEPNLGARILIHCLS